MDEYYNYVNGFSDLPLFTIDDPENEKFEYLITRLINDNDLFYNDINKRKRLSKLYKNLVKADFIFSYLSIDETNIDLTKEEELNLPESIISNIVLVTNRQFLNASSDSLKIYQSRLLRFKFIRVFIENDYKIEENKSYGSLDSIIEEIEDSIEWFIKLKPFIERTITSQ